MKMSSEAATCIDLRPLQTASAGSGIGTYCYNLAKHLLQVDSARRFIYLTLSNYRWHYDDLTDQRTHFRTLFRPRKPERLHAAWDYFCLRSVKFPNTKLIHLTQPSCFTVKDVINVVTLYDLIPLRYPEVYLSSPDVRILYRKKLENLTRCDAIICISESVKDDAVSLLGVPESRCVVIPLGVNAESFRKQDHCSNNSFARRFDITKNYILNVGGMDYRKNVLNLVKAFIRSKRLHADFQMVIVGRKSAQYASIEKEIITAGKRHLFVFPGALSKDDITQAYHGASLFAYPSFYEGFGLPPLEAMAAGVPTMTSNTSSLPEVVGDAALLVDPADVEQIADGLDRLARSTSLRACLIEKGLNRVKEFRWASTALRTSELYNTLA